MPSRVYAIILALGFEKKTIESSRVVARARGDGAGRAERRAKVEREWALENEKEVEEERPRGCSVREDGENEKVRREESEGSRREELLYVTVVLAVRCGRSRRCLLIYWRDSFRRRAAFPKWVPPRAPRVPFNAPAATSRRTFRFTCGRRRERESVHPPFPRTLRGRSLIFISDRRSGVTPRIKSRVIDGGRRLVRYRTMTAAFVRRRLQSTRRRFSLWTPLALIRMIHDTRGDLRLSVNKVK